MIVGIGTSPVVGVGLIEVGEAVGIVVAILVGVGISVGATEGETVGVKLGHPPHPQGLIHPNVGVIREGVAEGRVIAVGEGEGIEEGERIEEGEEEGRGVKEGIGPPKLIKTSPAGIPLISTKAFVASYVQVERAVPLTVTETGFLVA